MVLNALFAHFLFNTLPFFFLAKHNSQTSLPRKESLIAPDITIESDNGRTPKVYNHQPSGPNGFVGQKEGYRPRDDIPAVRNP